MSVFPKSETGRSIVRNISVALALVAAITAVFYAEEDLRGWLAWKHCRQALQAKDAQLNWSDHIPPPVPDDQNFFKAPKMGEWFVRQDGQTTNELTQLSKNKATPLRVAEFIVLPTSTNSEVSPEVGDIALRYSSFGPALFENLDAPAGKSFPLIMSDVPITTAIEFLAKRAGISYVLDPGIGYGLPDGKGARKPEPQISVRWDHINERSALLAILNQYNLQLVDDPKASENLITAKDSNAPSIYAAVATRQEFEKVFQDKLQKLIRANTIAPQGFILITNALPDIRPARIVLYSETNPGDREIRELFGQFFPNDALRNNSLAVSVERDGTNSWRVVFPAQSAADYLAASERFVPDFNLIREALRRPYARMDGNYANPATMPAANFVAVRRASQTLAARAQCDLLMGRPDQALQELTLLHEMCRMLEAAPSGKPMTLVAAMIDSAISGLNVNIIADGLQSHAWSGPQLTTLQQQLAEIHLTPQLLRAFREELAGTCHMLETMPVLDWAELNDSHPGQESNKVDELVFDWFWPRGWTDQNELNLATLYERWQQGFDPAGNLVLPRKFDAASRQVERFDQFAGFGSPYKLLAAIAFPNLSKAAQTTAYNQTRVNEARIACALEGYRLVHGDYPETLDALLPQFIEKLPPDIIGGGPLQYRRTVGDNFLLYSLGWNGVDDGGTPANDWFDWKGDWVWSGPI